MDGHPNTNHVILTDRGSGRSLVREETAQRITVFTDIYNDAHRYRRFVVWGPKTRTANVHSGIELGVVQKTEGED